MHQRFFMCPFCNGGMSPDDPDDGTSSLDPNALLNCPHCGHMLYYDGETIAEASRDVQEKAAKYNKPMFVKLVNHGMVLRRSWIKMKARFFDEMYALPSYSPKSGDRRQQ